MSLQETNKTIIQKYFTEYWGKGNVSVVDELCTENFTIDYPMHGPRRGKEAAKKMLLEFREAFPNISFQSYKFPLIAEGDYVVGRWIGGGKHTGVAFDDLAVGKLDRPNTGREVYFSGTTIFTLKDGKIVDEIGEEQALTALQQLGLVAAPNAGKEVRYDEGNHV
ncbi:hypothetical protein ASPWEDRAFT_155134 [Aspergillus wentii DTO 134E9]|uniref:SnoaL-like domain-containing protein n=1 Tax=Aspergillus wentii DTO 134E9 TaxID=1073089 RepID=A0A1L9RKD3_ASPWE|nr:uncharacterized protein ASPWEDRAFT_155134 [Aspergillus wentii DTO 134E9]OJJ35392.1 hypothetical protein ASPWEDRAFT_155134 [Aspergillus wentii DTO 134E9]